MEVTVRSIHTGIDNTRVIPATEQEYRDWQEGMAIKRAMPNLSEDDIVFLETGITPEEGREMEW